jgi:hypothetical protein
MLDKGVGNNTPQPRLCPEAGISVMLETKKAAKWRPSYFVGVLRRRYLE